MKTSGDEPFRGAKDKSREKRSEYCSWKMDELVYLRLGLLM